MFGNIEEGGRIDIDFLNRWGEAWACVTPTQRAHGLLHNRGQLRIDGDVLFITIDSILRVLVVGLLPMLLLMMMAVVVVVNILIL